MGGEHEEGGRFRFRRSPIDRIVGDRELMLRQAEARAEAAERRVQELERALDELRAEEGAARRGRRGGGRGAPRGRGPGEAGGSNGGEDDFQSALASIERGARKILDQMSGEPTRGEAAEVLTDLEAHLARLGAWRDRIDPSMRSLRARIEEVRASIEDLPERVQEALGPLASGLQAAEAEIAAFSEATDFALPPDAPSGGRRSEGE